MQVSSLNDVNTFPTDYPSKSKMSTHLRSRFKCVANMLSLIALTMSSTSLLAQDNYDWWFDVEVIAFKRNTASAPLEEDFDLATFTRSENKPIDLLSLPLDRMANPLHHLQAMLYACSPQNDIFVSTLPAVDKGLDYAGEPANNDSLELFPRMLDTEERFTLLFDPFICNEQKLAIARSSFLTKEVVEVPVYLQQPAFSVSENAHLLADEQLNLLDFAEKLFKQRNISPLAHFSWRQPVVFGEDEASFYHVFSGDKLYLPKQAPPDYDVLKAKYEPELKNVIDQNSETFFVELKQQLNEGKQVNWNTKATGLNDNDESVEAIDDVWELDGILKVYLKNVNRVPYLHIESEFFFHEMVINQFGEAEIEQYPFKQRRRIISKQIHYFDHPKIGLVIRLQRYEPPVTGVENSDTQ